MTLAAIIVAIYAALVATASLIWQIVSALRRHRSRVQLRVTWEGGPGAVSDEGERGGDLVVAQVINFSDHHVKVDSWGWYSEFDGPEPRTQTSQAGVA